MSSKEEFRKQTLDKHIDEKFSEIFFLAKEEYDIGANTEEERQLYSLLQKFKSKLKKKCDSHFSTDDD